MNTENLPATPARSGQGRICIVFGEYARGVAGVLLEDGTLLRIHDARHIQAIRQLFGSTAGAAGNRIRYETDALGIIVALQAG